eukprot:GHVL01032124.1.p1 GENE.GHVL01032124.1~~GHVL01032124.1.p1  ORF type:complete len:1157 (+),score=163.34 GHVL01032124.1:710-4180(+)
MYQQTDVISDSLLSELNKSGVQQFLVGDAKNNPITGFYYITSSFSKDYCQLEIFVKSVGPLWMFWTVCNSSGSTVEKTCEINQQNGLPASEHNWPNNSYTLKRLNHIDCVVAEDILERMWILSPMLGIKQKSSTQNLDKKIIKKLEATKTPSEPLSINDSGANAEAIKTNVQIKLTNGKKIERYQESSCNTIGGSSRSIESGSSGQSRSNKKIFENSAKRNISKVKEDAIDDAQHISIPLSSDTLSIVVILATWHNCDINPRLFNNLSDPAMGNAIRFMVKDLDGDVSQREAYSSHLNIEQNKKQAYATNRGQFRGRQSSDILKVVSHEVHEVANVLIDLVNDDKDKSDEDLVTTKSNQFSSYLATEESSIKRADNNSITFQEIEELKEIYLDEVKKSTASIKKRSNLLERLKVMHRSMINRMEAQHYRELANVRQQHMQEIELLEQKAGIEQSKMTRLELKFLEKQRTHVDEEREHDLDIVSKKSDNFTLVSSGLHQRSPSNETLSRENCASLEYTTVPVLSQTKELSLTIGDVLNSVTASDNAETTTTTRTTAARSKIVEIDASSKDNQTTPTFFNRDELYRSCNLNQPNINTSKANRCDIEVQGNRMALDFSGDDKKEQIFNTFCKLTTAIKSTAVDVVQQFDYKSQVPGRSFYAPTDIHNNGDHESKKHSPGTFMEKLGHKDEFVINASYTVPVAEENASQSLLVANENSRKFRRRSPTTSPPCTPPTYDRHLKTDKLVQSDKKVPNNGHAFLPSSQFERIITVPSNNSATNQFWVLKETQNPTSKFHKHSQIVPQCSYRQPTSVGNAEIDPPHLNKNARRSLYGRASYARDEARQPPMVFPQQSQYYQKMCSSTMTPITQHTCAPHYIWTAPVINSNDIKLQMQSVGPPNSSAAAPLEPATYRHQVISVHDGRGVVYNQLSNQTPSNGMHALSGEKGCLDASGERGHCCFATSIGSSHTQPQLSRVERIMNPSRTVTPLAATSQLISNHPVNIPSHSGQAQSFGDRSLFEKKIFYQEIQPPTPALSRQSNVPLSTCHAGSVVITPQKRAAQQEISYSEPSRQEAMVDRRRFSKPFYSLMSDAPVSLSTTGSGLDSVHTNQFLPHVMKAMGSKHKNTLNIVPTHTDQRKHIVSRWNTAQFTQRIDLWNTACT